MIRLTKLADYGIVLMTRLAAAPTGTVHTARGLALSAGVPLPTVSKILKVLAHASPGQRCPGQRSPEESGVLVSHRGVGGGFALAREPERISVAEVIAALEGPIAITECLGDVPGVCELEAGCPVRSNWDRINRVVREALEGLSIADMARPLLALRTRVGTGAP